MSQSQPEKAEVVESLKQCDCKHCQALLQYVIDDGISIEQIGYEDVFTPLRHQDDLRLVVDGRIETRRYLVRSDLMFRESDTEHTWQTAVDPFSVWNVLDHPEIGVRFEVKE